MNANLLDSKRIKYVSDAKMKKGEWQYRVWYEPLQGILGNIRPLEYMRHPREQANRAYLAQMRASKPLFVLECNCRAILYPSTLLESLQYINHKVHFFSDDDWQFHMFSRYIAQYYDLAITTCKARIEDYKRIGVPSVWVQWGGNKDTSGPPCGDNYKYDVTFIGGPHGYRDSYIRYLLRHGIKVRIFGKGWWRYPDLYPYWRGYLSNERFGDVIRTSKINLSFVEASILGGKQVKARVFEIPCLGGFMLCEYCPELHDYYRIPEEIETFRDKRELLHKINYYLRNEPERREIARRGYERAFAEHTWDVRYRDMFEKVDICRLPRRAPYLSRSRILVAYIAEPNAPLDDRTILSINHQTVPNVVVYLDKDDEFVRRYRDRIKYPITNRLSANDLDERYDYLTFIRNGTVMLPEKLQLQAFSLDFDRNEGIDLNYCSWGIYDPSCMSQIGSFSFKSLRKGEDANFFVLADSAMFSCQILSTDKNYYELLLRSQYDALCKKFYSDGVRFRFIDVDVSLLLFPSDTVLTAIRRQRNRKERNRVYSKVRFDRRELNSIFFNLRGLPKLLRYYSCYVRGLL